MPKKEEEVKSPDEIEEEEGGETSLLDLFAKWVSEKMKTGRKKRFAEVE